MRLLPMLLLVVATLELASCGPTINLQAKPPAISPDLAKKCDSPAVLKDDKFSSVAQAATTNAERLNDCSAKLKALVAAWPVA